MSKPELYLGLISGTSADGIDAALAHFTDSSARCLAARTFPVEATLRAIVLDLGQSQATIDLDLIGHLDARLGEAFADAAITLLQEAGVEPSAVSAIGSHGQTLRHRPQQPWAFTLQLADPTRIAERTGIQTIADFRRSDVAAGGQGAPLAPAFHAAVFTKPGTPRAVLNLGGIANLTLLPTDSVPIRGFDSGPANGLLDAWCQQHTGQAYDRNGKLAEQGQVLPTVLRTMLDDPYFALPPPKSTGREYFNLDWLEAHLAGPNRSVADVQATLLELSACTSAQALARYAPDIQEVLACGGGVHNPVLMQRLGQALTPARLMTTAELGVDPDFVEALAFAWLARQRLRGRPGNLPAVTGAHGPRQLGAIYPAP